MILTPSLTDNASKVLNTPADGTGANSQAREKAKSYLSSWLDQMKKFSSFPGFDVRYKKIQKLVSSSK